MSVDAFRDRLVKEGHLFKKSYEEVNAEFDKCKTVVEGQGQREYVPSAIPQSRYSLNEAQNFMSYADMVKMYGGNEELAKYWFQKRQQN